ncbi:hypothetical protein CORT_0A11900 [Candida orthopsilosis Co 90-125]|uniref:Uncharacterized protein n=1 Tax=Candida orthopsilosis (strain 90-125) TaxID=1136231 RepID=H8WYU3_CANO9|nr:hypothetical protein CORT_0A11900 [Candida orthopsilosis Co 90-125]CCG21575.1 hypothetical protein CORT_0A11900 [Candida orthopsilosis Co 90-125]
MGRKKKAYAAKSPPRKDSLASAIGDTYSLVSGDMNESGPQSVSNSTLKLLSQLKQKPIVGDQKNYCSGYNPYNEVELGSPYLNVEHSSVCQVCKQYQDEISPPFKEHKMEGDDLMQASNPLADTSPQPFGPSSTQLTLGYSRPTSQYNERMTPEVQAIKGPHHLALPSPKPLLTQDKLQSTESTNSKKPTSKRTQPQDDPSRAAIPQNLENGLESHSNFGAVNNVETQVASEVIETTIKTTENGSVEGNRDMRIDSLSNNVSYSTFKSLQNPNGKLIETSSSIHGSTPIIKPEGKVNPTPSEGFQNGSKVILLSQSDSTASHTLADNSIHRNNDSPFCISSDSQQLKPSNDSQSQSAQGFFPELKERGPFTSFEEKQNWRENPITNSNQTFFGMHNEQAFGNAALKKNAPITSHAPSASKTGSLVKPTERVSEQQNPSNKRGLNISHDGNPTKSSYYNDKKAAKGSFQEYSRFGRQDIFKSEKWVSQKGSTRPSKNESGNYSQRLRSSSQLEHKGVNSYKPRTSAHEEFEPPTKKYKFEPGDGSHVFIGPKCLGDRKSSGGFPGLQNPLSHTNGFNDSAQRGSRSDFKIYGESKFARVPYTKNKVEAYLEKSLSHPNLKIAYFVQTSQEFVDKAHELLVIDKSVHSVINYHKFIKAAIKCLLILVKKYTKDLTPHQLVSLYYKIARLYLNETESFDVAEKYTTKASKVCRDHSLIEFQFFCDLLMIEIYEKIDVTIISGFTSRRVENYGEAGFHLLASCLQLARIKYLLVSDSYNALVNLQRVAKDPKLHPIVKKIATIYMAGLHNYRGNPSIAVELLRGHEEKASEPFAAYILMTKLLANVSLNNTPESKLLLKELMQILNNGDKSKWKQWSVNGDIKFHVKGELNIEFDFVISWLPVVDFKIMLYFLSGIAYLHSIGDRSKFCLDKAYTLIGNAQDDLKKDRNLAKYFTANEARQRDLKLRYMRYLVQYYQQWQLFVNDDTKILFLNDFMNTNNKLFTREEYTIFKPIYPYIHYMFALYYHSRGDLQAAKFYYLKVRNMTSIVEVDSIASLQQMNNGLGGDAFHPQGKFSELHVYSTFQLTVLLDYEVGEIMSKKETEESKLAVEKLTSLRNTLFEEFKLVNIQPESADQFKSNFVLNNKLIDMTLDIIMRLLHGIEFNLDVKDLKSMLVKIGDHTTFYFVSFLVTYVLVINTSGTNERLKFIKRCMDLFPKSRSEVVETPLGKKQVSISESVDSCRVFFLRCLMQVHESNGLHNQVDMDKVQLERLCKLLAPRYTTLKENVTYDPTFKSLSQSKSEKEDVEMKDG